MKINYLTPENCQHFRGSSKRPIVSIYRTGLITITKRTLDHLSANGDCKFLIASEDAHPTNLYILSDKKGFSVRPCRTDAVSFNSSILARRILEQLKVPEDVKSIRLEVAHEPIKVEGSKIPHWGLIYKKRESHDR